MRVKPKNPIEQMNAAKRQNETDATLRIFEEVRKEGGEAWENLRAKCEWERLSMMAVIRIWGDPRTWNFPR
jgi:hypothetical protein